jgi:hypothetical protein
MTPISSVPTLPELHCIRVCATSITLSASFRGCVYFSAPRLLVRGLLIQLQEPDTCEDNLPDTVGEVANTISGNARRHFGTSHDPRRYRADQDFDAYPAVRNSAALAALRGSGGGGSGAGMTRHGTALSSMPVTCTFSAVLGHHRLLRSAVKA